MGDRAAKENPSTSTCPRLQDSSKAAILIHVPGRHREARGASEPPRSLADQRNRWTAVTFANEGVHISSPATVPVQSLNSKLPRPRAGDSAIETVERDVAVEIPRAGVPQRPCPQCDVNVSTSPLPPVMTGSRMGQCDVLLSVAR